MTLTPQQISHFRTFGYLVHRQVFAQREISQITLEADELWRQARLAGKRKDSHMYLAPFIEPLIRFRA